MSETSHPALIFDESLAQLRRARADAQKHFLLPRICEDIAERLLDVNRRFEQVTLISDFDIRGSLPTERVAAAEWLSGEAHIQNPLAESSRDLILSVLGLHHINDVPGALIQMRRALKPDGLMMAVLFGGETLTQLRQVLYATEEAVLGGISPRVHPFADYSAMAALLQRTGFALPVVDSDRINVRYSSLPALFQDLRDMGETNVLRDRSRQPLSRRFVIGAAQTYAEMFGEEDGKLPATFELIYITGWAPHESQQKPLKPGSAKVRLADALNTQEKKLP